MQKITKTDFQRLLAAILALALVITLQSAAQAQQELLTNTTFDSYYGAGGANVVPVGWTLTTNIPVNSSKQVWIYNEFPGFDASWEVSVQKAAFTMVASQFVAGIRAGTPLRFSVYSNVFTCDKDTSCIDAELGYRVSQQESQARTRIGIDPKGGSDPNAESVVWSPFISPFDRFEQAIIDTRSQNDNGVTLYLYATQSFPMLLNKVYWDNASLQVLGPAQAAATEVPRIVPFVTPQGLQPDGSIVHIVRAGDTLASIAVAYRVTVDEIRKLNGIPPEEYLLQIGQRLLIKTPPPPPVTYIIVTATPTLRPGQATPTPTPTPTATRSGGGALPFTIITLAVPPPTNTPRGAGHKTGTTLHTLYNDDRPGLSDSPVRFEAAPASYPARALAAAETEASICVVAFDDLNENRFRDANEALLAGVALRLTQGDQEIRSLSTAAAAPVCFENLAVGTYAVIASPPERYGLTTPAQLRVEIRAADQFELAFGAAAGYAAPPPTAPPRKSLKARAVNAQDTPAWVGSVLENSGLIMLGLAGAVLVGGLGLALAVRRH